MASIIATLLAKAMLRYTSKPGAVAVNPSVCYEVIRIRQRDAFEIKGRLVEAAEVYPNSDAWGLDGFTFTDKDAAFAKLREVAKT